MAALEPHIKGEARIHELFKRIRAADIHAADLYAEDAVFILGGRRVEGRDAIREFYLKGFEVYQAQPTVQQVLSAPGSDTYAAILEVPTKHGIQRVFDLLVVDDEGIRLLEVFSRATG